MRRLTDRPLARTGLVLAALGAACLALVGVNAAVAEPAAPPTAAVSGVVFYDRDGDGVRDPGEPGVAGIRVRDKKGDLSTVTSATGAYALTGLPTKGYLLVETGWFRTQCPAASDPTATSCPAGPGPDNDFHVDNQFIEYALSTGGTSADVGLVPDWPGTSMSVPTPVDGVIPANPLDVAARLSADSGTCADGDYVVCRAGDTFTMVTQVYNEGTTALTGVTARLFVPPGDCATSIAVLGFTVPDGLGPVTWSPAAPTCATRYLTLTYGGTLAPAAGVRVAVGGKTAGGPGTPGCVVKKPTKSCPTSEPQGRGWLFGVSHVDQVGSSGTDPDSAFCAAGDMSVCPIGLHDKRRAPDDIDPAGHNVDAALGGSHAYDLVARATPMPSDGSAVTLRAWATNRGPNASPTKVTLKAWFPTGTHVLRVPPTHVLIKCDKGVAKAAGVVVTCVLGAPVAPNMGSPAADITVVPPAGATSVPAEVCVAPPSSAAAESVPAATCDASTDPSSTATDNDAKALLGGSGP